MYKSRFTELKEKNYISNQLNGFMPILNYISICTLLFIKIIK